jgi:hypothetical protein
MRVIVVFCLLFITVENIAGQLNIKIKEMEISNIINTLGPDILYDEDMEDGPCLSCIGIIENNTDSIIVLNWLESEIILYFRYKGILFDYAAFPFSGQRTDTIILHPQEIINIYFAFDPMLAARALQTDTYDYTKEMFEILPTIRIYYKNKQIKIRSHDVLNVKLIDY